MFCPYCGEKQKDQTSNLCHSCQKDLGFIYMPDSPPKQEDNTETNTINTDTLTDNIANPTSIQSQYHAVAQSRQNINGQYPIAPTAYEAIKNAESNEQLKSLKNSFVCLIIASILIFATILHGIFGLSHIYTTGFGIGTIAEHIHLFHLGYPLALRIDAYVFASLGLLIAGISIYHKKMAFKTFVAHQNKIECLIFVLSIAAFAVPILMSIFPVVEL